MFRNYVLTTLRNLWKNKTYGFLNIFGLAIGIASAGLIFLWVESEYGYDEMYAKKDQLYQVYNNQTYSGQVRTFDDTPGPLGPGMKKEIPGVVNTCRVTWNTPLFSLGDKAVYEPGAMAEPSLFSMFSLQFVQGNPKEAFPNLNSIVITERMAKQFFGNEGSVLGRVLKMDNKENYTVTGVIRDFPANSSLQLDWVTPFEIWERQSPWLSEWGSNSLTTFAELAPSANVATVGRQLAGMPHNKDPRVTSQPILFSMNDWHLRDNFVDGKISGGRIEYVRLFSLIAWIILLIACINFMNLATARSEKRAREVGVRKVLGAGRSRLILQFIGEAVFLSFLAVLVGLLLMSLVMPLFNLLVQQQLSIGLNNPAHIITLAAITLICGVVAGSYPALYLSSFNPTSVFKGVRTKSGGAAFTRKSLVVLQFTVSIVLIVCTIVVYRQVQHIKSRDLGYNRSNLLDIHCTGNMVKDFPVIKRDLLATGAVENAALSSVETIYTSYNTTGFRWDEKDPGKAILVSFRYISPEYMQTLGMHIVEGRDLREPATSDSTHVVITETMARLMGKGSSLGKMIYDDNDNKSYQVVGVIKDYVYGDMYGKPDPVIYFAGPERGRYLYVRARTGVPTSIALDKIGAVMKRDNPAYPFTYTFVDDQFNARFTGETLIGKLSGIFATLAVFISCLGLFGLASYTAERRTREIGIRKVLGASVTSITGLLTEDFLRLVLISNLVALPVGWWFMHRWLDNFAYHTQLSWWIFLAAGLLALMIALLTVSFQSIRAALSNPIKSLRTE